MRYLSDFIGAVEARKAEIAKSVTLPVEDTDP